MGTPGSELVVPRDGWRLTDSHWHPSGGERVGPGP